METPQQPAVPEHSTGQVPTPRTPPAGGPPPPMFPVVPDGKRGRGMVPRSRRARLAIAVIGGVLALLCVGGIGITFVLYDDATKIDRGSPITAVDNFLIAYLINRDDAQANLYVCGGQADLAEISTLRDGIVQRERDFDVTVGVSWGVLTRSPGGSNQEVVRTELTIAGSSDGQVRSSRNESWEFRTIDQNGWRVCAATRVP